MTVSEGKDRKTERDNCEVKGERQGQQHVLVTKYNDLHRHDDHLTTHRHSRFSFYFLMSMTLLRPFVLSDLK